MRDPNVVITWEWWRKCGYQWWLDVKMKFVDHVLRSFEWSHVEIIWLVGLVIMILQLPSFLDTSSVERESRLLRNGNLVKNLPTQWRKLKRKTGRPWKHFSPVGKLMSLKRLCHYRKTSQLSYWRLRRKTGYGNQLMKNLQNLIKKCERKTKRS